MGNSKRLGEVMRAHHEEIAAKHPSVGLTRNLGLFGILELVKDRDTMEPLSPFNVAERDDVRGEPSSCSTTWPVHVMVRFNGIMTNPPLCITEEQLAEGFEIIDEALEIADVAMEAWRMGERIGFIGLGIMGEPMARNLMGAGFPSRCTREARARRRAGRDGAALADDPAGVAAATSSQITMLPDTADVEPC